MSDSQYDLPVAVAPLERQVGDVGLIGLGLMGSALAERLIAGGYRVAGFDLDADQCSAGAQRGVVVAGSALAVFERCDRVILSLPHSGIVRQLLKTAAPALRPGQLLIDTTTGDPADARLLGERLSERAIAYLDATVSGNSDQLRRREVTVMAGGDAAAYERARDLFDCFARRSFHVGPCGAGATMKLVTNLVLGLNRVVLAEGLAFAKCLGLDLRSTLGVMRESMAYSKIMDVKGEKMIDEDFEPQAKLTQHLKDVRLILAAAEAGGVSLPLSQAHRLLLERAEAAGLGERDNSAIIRAYDPALPLKPTP